jgi:hypothetical protein
MIIVGKLIRLLKNFDDFHLLNYNLYIFLLLMNTKTKKIKSKK